MIRFVVEVSLFITLSSILVTSSASPLQQGRVTPEKSYEGFLDEPASDDSLYLNNRLRDYGWGQQGVLMTDLKRDQQHGEKRNEEDKRNHRGAHSFQAMIGKRFFDQQRPLQEEKPKCAMEVVLSFLLGSDKTINDPEVKQRIGTFFEVVQCEGAPTVRNMHTSLPSLVIAPVCNAVGGIDKMQARRQQ